ncbi:MAG: DsbA family protein [Pseudomonadota bacterium]
MIMKRLFALLLALWALPAAALELDEMSAEERAAFGDAVRAYLLANPQVIFEAVAIFEQQQAAAEARADLELVAQNRAALFEDARSWVGGNPEGDITLVEFLDYKCGFCKRAHSELAQLLEADGNIRLIVKEFPILGEQSVTAARFALAVKNVAGDAAYKDVNDALMTFNGEIADPALRRLSSTFGLDWDAVQAEMGSDAVTQQIRDTRALAQRLNITGTPTFVLEDEMLRGFLPADQLAALVAVKRE